MRLEAEQEQLLVDLVEAERRVPREQRSKFLVAHSHGPPGVQLIHPGWIDRSRRVFEGDLEVLASAGLLFSGLGYRDTPVYHVTPDGFEYYRKLMAGSGAPVERIEERVRRYLDSSQFRSRHPSAFQKWSEAEVLLWGDDTERNLTMIGHLCRESIQEFATSLILLTKTTGADPDPTKTVARVRAVLNSKRVVLRPKRAAFLDALLAYWGTVSDLVQRQEHGGQKEGEPLQFPDGLRLVFQTMIVMYEVDSATR
jgi:hypothetical protein